MKKLFLGMLLVGAYFWAPITYAMTDEAKEEKTPRSPMYELVSTIRTIDDVTTILKRYNTHTLNYAKLLFNLARHAYGLLNQASVARNLDQTLIQHIEKLFAGCLLVYDRAVKHERNGQALAAQVSNQKIIRKHFHQAIQCLSPVMVDTMLTFYRHSGRTIVELQLDLTLITCQMRELLALEKLFTDHPDHGDEEEYRRTQHKLQRCKAIIALLVFKFGVIPLLNNKKILGLHHVIDRVLRESLSNMSTPRRARLIQHLAPIHSLRSWPADLLALMAKYIYDTLPPAQPSEAPDMGMITYQGIPEIDRDIVASDGEEEIENLGRLFGTLEVE